MSTVTDNISAAQVKELREKTGAPMMDCRNALAEAKGASQEQALVVVLQEEGEWLRQRKEGVRRNTHVRVELWAPTFTPAARSAC